MDSAPRRLRQSGSGIGIWTAFSSLACVLVNLEECTSYLLDELNDTTVCRCDETFRPSRSVMGANDGIFDAGQARAKRGPLVRPRSPRYLRVQAVRPSPAIEWQIVGQSQGSRTPLRLRLLASELRAVRRLKCSAWGPRAPRSITLTGHAFDEQWFSYRSCVCSFQLYTSTLHLRTHRQIVR